MNKSKISHHTVAPDRCDVSGSCSQYYGRLMTPSEVAQATIEHSVEVRQVTACQWVLCGDVSTQMFRLIQKAPKLLYPMRLSGFGSSHGVAYCAITLQAELHQCRFVLPLYDPSFRSFIEAMTRSENLTLSLGNDGGDEALLLRSPMKPLEYMPVLALSSKATPEEQREALFELPTVQAIMGHQLKIPSLLEGLSVQHVCVSLLLPSILNDCYQDALAKAAVK